MNRLALLCLAALTMAACAALSKAPAGWRSAAGGIRAEELLAHVRVLASDEFEGRGPGTAGETLSVDYLTARFRDYGLAPGNPDGSYAQDVPLVGLTAQRSATLSAGGKKMHFRFPDDYVAVTRRVEPEVRVSNTDLVFVGYGVVAPEYGWDDYKGVDVRGKTLVMLINDPAIPDPADPARLDDAMFKGRAMTYYGCWTYKYEIASEKGAAAALIIHETGPAGYPYEVVSGSWGRENFDLEREDGNRGRVPIEAWISEERARKLFELSGTSLEAMKAAAIRKDFRPVALPAKASFTLRNAIRHVKSKNVVAKVEGSDPELKDQVVIYTAHWDHLGLDPALKGDQVFNGAVDNASGCATLLELGRAFAALPVKPPRSVVFLSVTAEEKGLLGSKWYAEHPLYPLARTAANINMDSMNMRGRTRDVVVVGKGQSTLEDVLAGAVAVQDRVLIAETQPEKGSYYRSDHFEFAKVGVPALDLHSGEDYLGRPAGWGAEQKEAFVAHDYHKVSDEVKPEWDLSGLVEDTQLLLRLGLAIASDPAYPEWKEGSEFRARREAMLKTREKNKGDAHL